MESAQEVRAHALTVLRRLDWQGGLTLDDITRQMLQFHLNLPDELVAAIPPARRFADPEALLASLPTGIWERHARWLAEARGRTDLHGQTERTRRRGAP